jgi:hypothetical protein
MRAVAEAFTEHTMVSLERMDTRPASADPKITAQFLARGVLGVIGAWLAEATERSPLTSDEDHPSPLTSDELVEALIQCLPGWLLTD